MILLPGSVGEFARNGISPLPWVEFTNNYSTHGLSTAFLALIGIVIVDLWLFWTPSQMYKTSLEKEQPVSLWSYINKDNASAKDLQEDIDLLEYIHFENIKQTNKKKIIFARIINLLAGLLLITPNNPVYSLLSYF